MAFAWLAGLFGLQIGLYYYGNPVLVVIVPAVYWLALATAFCLLPEKHFATARIKPVMPRRYMAASRLFFMGTLFTALTYFQLTTGLPLWWMFAVLWVVPLVTAFPLFMILRQVVQHGNGDRGWLTNTRVFLVNPLLRYAIFPFGMDYHLPHHMYATVPHYRLPQFHAFLCEFPEYAEHGQVVQNYVVPAGGQPRRPTVVEVLGPEYAQCSEEVYVDNSVLDDWEVDEKEEILRKG